MAAADDALIVVAAGTDGTDVDDLLRPAAELIRDALDGHAEIVALDYPATGQILSLEWPGFVRLGLSPKAGVRALTRLLEDRRGSAPVVLLGFSQGALVITETLADPTTRRFAPTIPAPSPEALDRVTFAVSIGNPSFCAGEPFNRGTPAADVSGMFARPAGVLAKWQDRIVDLAEHDDVSAQHVPSSTMEGHLSYGQRGYAPMIAELVRAAIRS